MEFPGVFIKNHKSCFVTLEFPPTSKSRVSTWSGKSQKVREYDQGKVGRKFLSMQFLTSIKKIISTQKCLQLNCIWQSVVYMMLLFASSIKMIIVLIVCTPVFVKGGGVEPPTKFSKRGRGLTGPQLLEGVCWERGVWFFSGEGREPQLSHKK